MIIGIANIIDQRWGSGLNPDDFLIEGSGVPAYSAFSFRALSYNHLASGGKCCRIRRSSDNAEIDIGFVNNGTDYVVDSNAILSFAGAGNAYIVRMYDQSGNGRDRYSGIANRQPFVVASGSLQTHNGYVGALLSDQSHTLQTLFAFGLGDSVWPDTSVQLSSIHVAKQNASSGTSANTALNLWDNGGGQFAYVQQASGSSSFSGYTPGTQYKNDVTTTISTRQDAFNELYNQPYILEDWGLTKWATAQNNFGGYGLIGTTFWWFGYYMEEIYYFGDQIGSRPAIMSYITPYYSSL